MHRRVALVPNAEVFTSRIVNNTADPVRHGTAEIALGYNTDFQTLLPAIRGAVQRTEGVLERPVTIRIEDLGTDGVLMVVGFWTDFRRSDFKDTASSVRLAIVSTLRSKGVELPRADQWRDSPGDEDATSDQRLPQSRKYSGSRRTRTDPTGRGDGDPFDHWR